MAMPNIKEAVKLGERFEIQASRRLKAHDSGMAEAYAATDVVDPKRKVFALVSPGHLAHRGLTLAPRRSTTGTCLMWPLATGIIDWPVGATGGDVIWGRRPILIYVMPSGEKIVEADGTIAQMGETLLIRNFLQPAIRLLHDLALIGCTHRAIRPDNIFYQNGKAGEVMFGDCLASPPGSGQPASCETVENAMAEPVGRGPGTVADDLYAIGAIALMLFLGRDPVARYTEEQIITAKINMGSFSALAGGEKLAPSLAEMFRGLLNDKVADRWTARHLEGWINGRHFVPTLPITLQRASRPLKFCGSEYLNKPALAHGMSRHWSEAVALIEGVDFDNWFKRGFGDEKASDKMSWIVALASAYGPPSGMRDRCVARYIIHLGGPLPLCYMDTKTSLLGLGTVLSHFFDQTDRVQQIAELMVARLPHAWIEEQSTLRPEQMQIRRVLELVDRVIDRPGPGYGIERILYELDHGAPCRSPLIADYYVVSIGDLLPAIDAAIPGAPHGTLPMDHHIAAFMAAKMSRAVDSEMLPLNNRDDESAYRIAILRLLAIVQRVNQNYDLPRLSAAVREMLDPVIAAFHNTAVRDHIRSEVERHVVSCRFDEILLLLDGDGSLKRADGNGFSAAVRHYANLERGRSWLLAGGLTDTNRVRGIAQRAATITASLVCCTSLAAYGIYVTLF